MLQWVLHLRLDIVLVMRTQRVSKIRRSLQLPGHGASDPSDGEDLAPTTSSVRDETKKRSAAAAASRGAAMAEQGDVPAASPASHALPKPQLLGAAVAAAARW